MRVFVTGGAGFIGSCFIRHVLQRHADVRVTNFDKLTYAGNLANLRAVEDDPRYRFVRGDIADPEAVHQTMRGHDAVTNFAAESHVDRSICGSGDFMRTNVVGADVVFAAAMRHEIPRVIHVSTDEVYGSISEPGRFGEDDALRPSSPYSASKASADLLARAYGVTYSYPITVTRSTNNFGPYHYPEKVVPLFVTNLIDAQPVPLYGDGRNVRDWTYVDDNVAALWLILAVGQPGEVYNVGAGNELSNLALTRHLLEAFGVGEEMVERMPDRPGHDLRYAVDTRKIRALGWRPEHSFEAALEATIAWYRDHESWWRPLRAAGAGQRLGLPSCSQGPRE